MTNDHEMQIREVRRFAWLFVVVFLFFAAVLSWCWYDGYSTRAAVRASRMSVHMQHVREIQALPATAGGLTNAITSYLQLGVGAIVAADAYQDLANWIYVAAILICVCGLLLPIKVLRTFRRGQKTHEADDSEASGQ